MSSEKPLIYLDEAATSWPKPACVKEAVMKSLDRPGSPARSAHKHALEASRALGASRRKCADSLGVSDVNNVIFQPGCTQALNMLIKGMVKPGSRVLISPFEHNSVTRPLHRLVRERQIELIKLPVNVEGNVKLSELMKLLEDYPGSTVVCQHASNVSGSIQPIGDIADLVHKYNAKIIVDGAQSAGHIPFDFDMMMVDAWACSGHKGLRGPQGVGLAIVSDDAVLEELIEGGTGGGTEVSDEPAHQRPEAFEAGTPNLPGIEGLAAAVEYITPQVHERRKKEHEYNILMLEGLSEIEGIHILGPKVGVPRVPLVSFVVENVSCDLIASRLDQKYNVAVRSGLHCAPAAHQAYGTALTGTVRVSYSADTPREWIVDFPKIVKEIVSQQRLF